MKYNLAIIAFYIVYMLAIAGFIYLVEAVS